LSSSDGVRSPTFRRGRHHPTSAAPCRRCLCLIERLRIIGVGVVFSDNHERAGEIDLNPRNDSPVVEGDQIVLICLTSPDLSHY